MEKLERFVRRNGLHGTVRPMPWSLHCGFCARFGATVQDSKSGAAAAGRAAIRVEDVTGAGGAHYPGPPGPDSGGGERFNKILHLNVLGAAVCPVTGEGY